MAVLQLLDEYERKIAEIQMLIPAIGTARDSPMIRKDLETKISFSGTLQNSIESRISPLDMENVRFSNLRSALSTLKRQAKIKISENPLKSSTVVQYHTEDSERYSRSSFGSLQSQSQVVKFRVLTQQDIENEVISEMNQKSQKIQQNLSVSHEMASDMLDLTREQQKFIDQAEEDSEDLVRKTDDVLNNLKAARKRTSRYRMILFVIACSYICCIVSIFLILALKAGIIASKA